MSLLTNNNNVDAIAAAIAEVPVVQPTTTSRRARAVQQAIAKALDQLRTMNIAAEAKDACVKSVHAVQESIAKGTMSARNAWTTVKRLLAQAARLVHATITRALLSMVRILHVRRRRSVDCQEEKKQEPVISEQVELEQVESEQVELEPVMSEQVESEPTTVCLEDIVLQFVMEAIDRAVDVVESCDGTDLVEKIEVDELVDELVDEPVVPDELTESKEQAGELVEELAETQAEELAENRDADDVEDSDAVKGAVSDAEAASEEDEDDESEEDSDSDVDDGLDDMVQAFRGNTWTSIDTFMDDVGATKKQRSSVHDSARGSLPNVGGGDDDE